MIEFFIIIREEAETDLISIFDYYEFQMEGLGDRFITSFENSLQKLKNNPFHTFKISDNIRRAVTKKFPYSVYYMVIENTIVIFSVLHQYRKPEKILKRLNRTFTFSL